ncbi:MAG: V-type ATP synthase subunit E family protein [Candidatus Pelagibacter ubique]
MNKVINLDSLLETIEGEYERQKKMIIDKAKEDYEKILQKYRDEADRRAREEFNKIVEEAKRKAGLILQKKLSEAELNAKWELLKDKEEAFQYIVDKFLEKVYEKQYLEMAREVLFWHIYRTLKTLNVEKCVIRVNEKSKKLIDKDSLRKKLKEDGLKIKLSFKEDKSINGEAIIEALEGKLRVDCSFRGMIAKDEDLIKKLLNEKIFEKRVIRDR